MYIYILYGYTKAGEIFTTITVVARQIDMVAAALFSKYSSN